MHRRRLSGPFAICLAGGFLASGCGEKAPPLQPRPQAPPKVAVPTESVPSEGDGPVLPAPESSAKPAGASPAAAEAMPKQPSAGPAKAASSEESSEQPVRKSAERQLIDQIDDIGDRGAAAAESLPMLEESLAHASPEVRWHAARSMGLIGKDALPCIPNLVDRLQDEDPLVVAQAATAIGRIKEDDGTSDGPPTANPPSASYQAALEALVKTVAHADARVRRAALLSIKRLQPDREELADLLGSMLADSEPSVVMAALRSVADVGPPAVPFLAESLQRPKGRYWAAVALAEMGPLAVEAADELVAALAEADPVEKMQILLALAAIGEPAGKAATPLVEMLESGAAASMALEVPLVYALGQLRVEAAHEPLGRLLDSNDSILAGTAAWARARIHPDAPEEVAMAVDRLLKGTASDSPVIRQGTLSALADLSEEVTKQDAGRLASVFGKSLADPEVPVRMAGAESLARLGGDAVPALLEAVEDPQRRLIAIDVLGSLGPLAKDAVPVLVRLLGDADAVVRADAAFALGGIGTDAAEAVPALIELLKKSVAARAEGPQQPAEEQDNGGHDHGPPTYTAAYALGRIGPAAREAMPALQGLLDSGDPLLATVGVWSALQIEPDSAPLRSRAVPLLTQALKDEHDLVRLEASVALGEIGKPARETLEMLEIVAEDDPVPTVRTAAGDALRKLRGDPG